MSLRFLGIILRVLRLQVFVYNVYITNKYQTTFAQGGGRVKSLSREVNLNSKEEKSEDFCPKYVQEFGICRRTNVHIVHTVQCTLIYNIHGYQYIMNLNYEYPWKHRKNEYSKYLESLTVNVIYCLTGISDFYHP
jgi:hypothetical protein